MNRETQKHWIDEVLTEVFRAAIASEPLRNALIFKGARILNLHLGDGRESLDIDSNMAAELAASMPDIEAQARFLQQQLSSALRHHFERQNPVRFELVDVKVDRRPPKDHPRGWNAFLLRIQVHDSRWIGVIGLPRLEIDVAAPEKLGVDAVETMKVQGVPARVYALHRIAGEKLRAYLTSLPAYRQRMQGGEREFRVKDLHDLARILRARPASDLDFWAKAALEFKLACESRLVECQGLKSFMENWNLTRERYEADASLKVVPFAEAEHALATVVGLLELHKCSYVARLGS
ncbi:MAG TPA: nucleotidyl transferase AbiEii/AbiGii toxin family protein [Clostridia bacterium]|nr:nucleotidyl transferase AbiEii/AbiGii toxin family protein [Clostridia bacterium]